MSTSQLTPQHQAGAEMFLGGNRGWGLSVAVVTRRDAPSAVPGGFGWAGGYGTSWGADPAEDMVLILLTQRMWGAATPPGVYADFWTGGYAAIDD